MSTEPSTLAKVSVSVDSKWLTKTLTLLNATLTKNRGRGIPAPFNLLSSLFCLLVPFSSRLNLACGPFSTECRKVRRKLARWYNPPLHFSIGGNFMIKSTLIKHSLNCFAAFAAACFASTAFAQTTSTLPSEAPTQVKPVTDSFDYSRREVMIPMRDGVKLHTVILIPKGAKNAPILLTRTPYNATDLTTRSNSSHLGPTLYGYDNATDVIVEGGYIRVIQDVRGKYGSEGDYVMNRPLRGPLNPTDVDHATDTYDTIDWLVKNIPETNEIGRAHV